jgi:hypothetical protein
MSLRRYQVLWSGKILVVFSTHHIYIGRETSSKKKLRHPQCLHIDPVTKGRERERDREHLAEMVEDKTQLDCNRGRGPQPRNVYTTL